MELICWCVWFCPAFDWLAIWLLFRSIGYPWATFSRLCWCSSDEDDDDDGGGGMAVELLLIWALFVGILFVIGFDAAECNGYFCIGYCLPLWFVVVLLPFGRFIFGTWFFAAELLFVGALFAIKPFVPNNCWMFWNSFGRYEERSFDVESFRPPAECHSPVAVTFVHCHWLA